MTCEPFDSWTVRFFRDHWGVMTLPSLLRYRAFCIGEREQIPPPNSLLTLRLRRPITGDIWLRVDGADRYTFDEIVLKRVYANVVNKIDRCHSVIDLGANIGLATRYFATQYPNCTIFAVEPDSANYAMLQRNVSALVEGGRCQTVRGAVWGRPSRLTVEVPAGAENHFNAVFVKEAIDDETNGMAALTMSEILDRSGFSVVDILKMDIEGAEVSVFQGELNWLERIGGLAIEFHGDSRQESDFDRVMHQFGFQIDDSDDHTVVATRVGTRSGSSSSR